MMQVHSFEPVINKKSQILILGSIPGGESIRLKQYYASKNNRFWKIIYAIYNLEQEQSYEQKIRFISEKGIALWDVIKACERTGSLDSDIKNPTLNDFTGLFNKYPNIQLILFNGEKLYNWFKKNLKTNIKQKKLPSTSSSNSHYTHEYKLKEWEKAIYEINQ